MSRQQDLLFCKIAITSGKVTQEDAQKCLAIANRLEAEGKDRPQVGVIFIKKNLLAGDDVQRIYGAVKKRLAARGGTVTDAGGPPARSPGAAARPASGRGPLPGSRNGSPSRGPARAVRKQPPKPESIDPTTLWMGIIFGTVLLGCLIAMLYLLVFRQPEKPAAHHDIVVGAKAQAPAPQAVAAPAPTPVPPQPAPAPGKAAPAPGGEAPAPPAPSPPATAPPAGPTSTAPPQAAPPAAEKAAGGSAPNQ